MNNCLPLMLLMLVKQYLGDDQRVSSAPVLNCRYSWKPINWQNILEPMDKCRTKVIDFGLSWQLSPILADSQITSCYLSLNGFSRLLFLWCSFSCVYYSALSTTLQPSALVALTDFPELSIISPSAYPLQHWPHWSCSSAWFEVIMIWSDYFLANN